MNSLTALLLLAYFFAVVGLLMIKSGYLPGRAPLLFRAFFPSWRFFEEVCEVPELSYRVCYGEELFGPWQRCFEPPARGLSAILLNPECNLQLACNGLLHQLENDMEALPADQTESFIESVSYQLTRNLVIYRLRSLRDFNQITRFQFKVSAVMQGAGDEAAEDILISPYHQI